MPGTLGIKFGPKMQTQQVEQDQFNAFIVGQLPGWLIVKGQTRVSVQSHGKQGYRLIQKTTRGKHKEHMEATRKKQWLENNKEAEGNETQVKQIRVGQTIGNGGKLMDKSKESY